MNSSTSLTGYIAYLWSYSIVAFFVEAERVSRCSSHRKARRKALAWLVEGCSYSAAAVVVARASAASTTTTVSGSLRVMQLSSNSCCNTEDEVLLKTLKMLRPQPQKTVKAEEEQEEGGGGEEETEEDLICDAVENGEASKEGSEAACLQGCISSCFGALQDLRKVKVSEMVHQKVANSIISAAASENNEPILETVIEREDSIQKSTLDTYSYRYLELRNGLRVILASDLKSKTSAAALDIKIGSFHDPVHLQGLAHLCEHVLFTGSELYPNESYSAFLGQRGGVSNAFTASEHTNFHFEVPSEHFLEALKRFISFFQCPILRESSIQNELEIIQSEHEKNKYNDVWRTNQVERATANAFHVFSHFSTGTRQTLTVEKGAERSLRYELFQFYRTNYSANIMCLCLIHNESLDLMEDLTTDLLLHLPNKNAPERIWSNKPFRPKQMRTKIFIVPVKDVCHVNLTFPMEDISAYYAAAPAGQVAQLIGHKGDGGLYAFLRQKGWAHQLVASHKTLGKGFSLFMISVQLTDQGEKHTDEVIMHVFQFIHLLKKTGPVRWFFEELKYLSKWQFEQQDRERPQNYASHLAGSLHLYSPKEVVAADFIFYEWRPDLVERIYAYLSPDNVRVTILTKNAKYFATHVEPHYGTEYHVEKIDNAVLTQWRQCGLNCELRVPRPNDFIDKEAFSKIVEISNASKREDALPELFLNVDRIRFRAWHMPNTKSKIVKAHTFVKFYDSSNPFCAKKNCLNSLFAFMIRDCLSEVSYKAQLASLFYTLRSLRNGLELEIRGCSSKQDLFLEKILGVIFEDGHYTQERFAQVHTLHLNGLQSGDASKLKIQAKGILSHVLQPQNHLRESRLEAMAQINFQDLLEFRRDFLLNLSLETLFYGNLNLEGANRMGNSIITARKDFLERLAAKMCQKNEEEETSEGLMLEDWFKNDPVFRIVRLEGKILNSANSPKRASDKVAEENKENTEESNEEVELASDAQMNQQPSKTDPKEIESSDSELMSASNVAAAADYSLPKIDENDERHVVIVNNEVHSSSCVLYYLECSQNEPLVAAKLELFFHLVQVKLITAMKHVVPLGYVVNCDIRKVNGRLGFRITVESQYPLQMVLATIEESLEDLDDHLAKMEESQFSMSKAAVMSVKEDNMISMRDQAHALWREILDETYHFTRHQQELEQMSNLDLLDIRTFYRQWIHSKACERRCVVISIAPDPILNKLELPYVKHWTLNQLNQFRTELMTPNSPNLPSEQWFNQVFENVDNVYEPPC